MQDYRMETFLTACRLMNYTSTAQALHITQPAVSQHIHFLEENYHAKLFYYEGKKLHLTKAGICLRDTATTMKHDEIILKEQLETLGHTKLVFGATRTIGDFVMPGILRRCIASDPTLEVQMLVENTGDLLKKVNLGTLDFAVIEGYFRKAEYDYKVYAKQHYVALCSGAHVFAREPRGVSDLFSERIILREKGSGTRAILERYLEERNCSVQDFSYQMEIGSISAIKTLVAADCGITFLYEAAVKPELESGALQKIPLQDFNLYKNFTMVWRKNSVFRERYLKIFEELFPKAR